MEPSVSTRGDGGESGKCEGERGEGERLSRPLLRGDDGDVTLQ